LFTITFESQSKLQRIESNAFSDSGLTKIQIPNSVEVLCCSCFSECKSLFTITFESQSKLQRIESNAFSDSGLTKIQIPASVEQICSSCFADCIFLHTFQYISPSSLSTIGSTVFLNCALTTVTIPHSVIKLDIRCFDGCRKLNSLTFEYPSHLKRIEAFAFSNTSLHSVELPSRITFIAANAFPTNCQLISPTLTHSIIFITWNIARQNGSDHPFEKVKSQHHLPLLSNLSTETDFPATHPSLNLKHFPLPIARDCLDLFLSELESLLTLNHRCICPLAGVSPPTRSNGPILAVQFPSQTSLADLLCRPWQRWWTATTKSIVLTGIVLAMIHAHDRDVLHGNLNPNYILLDDNHRPKLCNFGIK
jgi:hypothetical protein